MKLLVVSFVSFYVKETLCLKAGFKWREERRESRSRERQREDWDRDDIDESEMGRQKTTESLRRGVLYRKII